ncbi:MAG: hypothetical protein CMJ34_13945 [Phycisphaerae bacterium]|nr:hypothetical protein [Phycisphaerae bacterium]
MGSVWGGEHVPRGVPVAVKVLHARFANDSWFRTSFASEVRAVARLDHPNIVTILDHGILSMEDLPGLPVDEPDIGVGSAWLAMERLSGTPMTRFKGRCPWKRLLPWLQGLLAGLGHAHARGLLHRDLKPANVLVDGDRAVLVDFGLARELDADPDEAHDGLVVGTPAYMSPEQFEADDAGFGPWTDLYGLGCLVWALVTGAGPHGQRRSAGELRHAHLNLPVPRLTARSPVPVGFEGWLRRLLARHPLDRYRCAADALHGLNQLATGAVEWASFQPPAEPPRTPVAAPLQVRWPEPVRRRDRAPELLGAGLRLFGLRQPPLIGRLATQERLWEALGDVHRGDARVVLLEGPAGAGKSRIVRWLAQTAHATGSAEVVHVRHGEEPGRGDGLIPALRRHLGLVGGDSAAARRRLDALADRWRLRQAERVELMAMLLVVGVVRRSGRGGVQRNSLLSALLDRLSEARPLLLCLDDVHWGSDTLNFVAQLLDRPPTLRPRVMILMTARPVVSGSPVDAFLRRILQSVGSERVPVGLLAPGWRGALIQSLAPVEPALAELVETRAGGNPLFTVQLLGDWVARGLLEVGRDGLRLTAGADVDLPSDLHALWQRRVDMALRHRSSHERQAVELAAVLGTHVDRSEWEMACLEAGFGSCDRVLDDLLSAGLAHPDPLGLERGFSFVHGMLAESLQRAAKAQDRLVGLREAVLAMLRRRASDEQRVALRTGHLLLNLGRPSEAIAPLGDGAWAAVRDSEFLEAERGLRARQAALEAIDAAPDDPRWGEGWVMQARVARRRGQLATARESTKQVLAASPAQNAGPHAARWTALGSQAHREGARLAVLAGEHDAAIDHARAALALARTLKDPVALAWCRRDYGLLRVQAGARMGEVDRLLAAAQSTFEATGEVFGAADCLRARAVVRHRERRSSDVEHLCRHARRALRRCLTLQEPAHTQAALGDVARLAGRTAEAVRWYAAARERFQHIGHPGPARLPWREAAARLDRSEPDPALVQQLIEGAAAVDAGFMAAVRARLWLAMGNESAAIMELSQALRGSDPEAAEQAEALARRARAVMADDLAAEAAGFAARQWGLLGWPARARRAGH